MPISEVRRATEYDVTPCSPTQASSSAKPPKIVNSRLNSAVYKYSLPDLKLVGQTEINGIDPNWVTLTPDGKTAYVAIAGSNWVAAIDIATMNQVAKTPVGYVPKRNAPVTLP